LTAEISRTIKIIKTQNFYVDKPKLTSKANETNGVKVKGDLQTYNIHLVHWVISAGPVPFGMSRVTMIVAAYRGYLSAF
jgi:hypothetical protein